MKRVIIVLIAVASLFLAPSAGAEKVTKIDRFQLWNRCQPMSLHVATLSKDAAKIGLTKESITTAVRSRLRAARLYDAKAATILRVRVNVYRMAFNIVIGYYKLMKDIVSKELLLSSNWDTGSIGTHGQSSNYIISSISEHTDKFIDEYLRVNNAACKR